MQGFISVTAKTCAVSMIVLSIIAGEALGHAFGRLGVDHYIRVTPRCKTIEVEFDVHFGEISTAAMSARLDTNHDGQLGRDEIMVYAEKAAPVYIGRLRASAVADGTRYDLPLKVPARGLQETCIGYVVQWPNGEKTLRIRWTFEAELPEPLISGDSGPIALKVESLANDKWHSSIFATGKPEPPVRIVQSDVPTDEQAPLPPDMTKQETDVTKIPTVLSALITCNLDGSGTVPPPPLAAATTPPEGKPTVDETRFDSGRKLLKSENKIKDRVLALFQPPLSTRSMALAIALCFVWGAMHAFTPGHGKAIVSAYLVSARGSYRHAFALGLLVTLTHTAVVMTLAIVALILKDRFVYPRWLAPLGAVMILLVGVNQLRLALMRLLLSGHQADHHDHDHDHDHDHNHNHNHNHNHDHDHDHDHPHPHQHTNDHEHGHDQEHGHGHAAAHTHWGFFSHSHASPHPSHAPRGPIGGKDIAIVGVSGGMVPCPASIVMLLFALQLGLPKLGLFCLLSFSTGLAAALTLVGILAVSGTRAVLKWLSSDDKHQSHRLTIETLVPLLGGVVLIVCGILMLLGLSQG